MWFELQAPISVCIDDCSNNILFGYIGNRIEKTNFILFLQLIPIKWILLIFLNENKTLILR
jgi:hypothetical protein